MAIKFTKMHGLGNDFVMIDTRSQTSPKFENFNDLSRTLAHRKFGIGCDQVVILSNSQSADLKMSIFNVDGSEAEICGNAARCAARLFFEEIGADPGASMRLETLAGVVSCRRAEDGLIRADMGEPRLEWDQIPLKDECDTLFVPIIIPTSSNPDDSENLPICVNVGNPHCVFIVGPKVESFPIEEIGAEVEHLELFPARTNVEFVHVQDRANIRMRVWERGSGVTMACGSAACASAVAVMRRGYTDRTVTVHMDGGDLIIEWNAENNRIYMTGPTAKVFEGSIEI